MNETAFTELEEIIERDYKNIAGMQISYDGAVIYKNIGMGVMLTSVYISIQ